MSEAIRRGHIKRTERGWSIHPEVWSEPKAAASPQARLSAGRIVRVTFDFILDEDATREKIEEDVTDALNERFDLSRDPTLEDLGARTDKPELLAAALRKSTPA